MANIYDIYAEMREQFGACMSAFDAIRYTPKGNLSRNFKLKLRRAMQVVSDEKAVYFSFLTRQDAPGLADGAVFTEYLDKLHEHTQDFQRYIRLCEPEIWSAIYAPCA